MRLLSWNCRGLGNPRAIRALLRLIVKEGPTVAFLMETRLKAAEMERIKLKCGFSSCVAVDCSGQGRTRAGGVALLWKNDVDITLISTSLNHIQVTCDDLGSLGKMSITWVYGFPDEANKKDTWRLIQRLSSSIDGPHLCAGDFNDIVDNQDKLGGQPRTFEQLSVGRDTLHNCGLKELPYMGYPFTWSNGIQEEENVQCRLDRAYVNAQLRAQADDSMVTHLMRPRSDHAPLLISLQPGGASEERVIKNRIFRFEEAWTNDPIIDSAIRMAWRQVEDDGVTKLGAMKKVLFNLNQSTTFSIRRDIQKVERELAKDINWGASDMARVRFQELKERHAQLLTQEEQMWRQRSRAI